MPADQIFVFHPTICRTLRLGSGQRVIKEQPLVLVKPATPVCCFADAWQSRGGDTRLRHLRYGLL